MDQTIVINDEGFLDFLDYDTSQPRQVTQQDAQSIESVSFIDEVIMNEILESIEFDQDKFEKFLAEDNSDKI